MVPSLRLLAARQIPRRDVVASTAVFNTADEARTATTLLVNSIITTRDPAALETQLAGRDLTTALPFSVNPLFVNSYLLENVLGAAWASDIQDELLTAKLRLLTPRVAVEDLYHCLCRTANPLLTEYLIGELQWRGVGIPAGVLKGMISTHTPTLSCLALNHRVGLRYTSDELRDLTALALQTRGHAQFAEKLYKMNRTAFPLPVVVDYLFTLKSVLLADLVYYTTHYSFQPQNMFLQLALAKAQECNDQRSVLFLTILAPKL